MELQGKVYCVFINPLAWYRYRTDDYRGFDKRVTDKVRYDLTMQRIHGDDPLWDVPIDMTLAFYMKLPHTVKHKNNNTIFHDQWPSVHEMSNIFVNGMRDTIITNPDIICRLNSKKIYAKTPRIVCIISESKPDEE
jgi:hypothetical protein